MFESYRRNLSICTECGGRGIAYQSLSRLPGLTARRPCRRCHGRGVR